MMRTCAKKKHVASDRARRENVPVMRTREKMQALFEAGAELVGTSSGPAIVDGVVGNPNAY